MAKQSKQPSAAAVALGAAVLPASGEGDPTTNDRKARRVKRERNWEAWIQSPEFLFVMCHLRRQSQNW